MACGGDEEIMDLNKYFKEIAHSFKFFTVKNDLAKQLTTQKSNVST